MPQFTDRLDLYLAGGGSSGLIQPDEPMDVDKFNDNFRKLDAAVGVTKCTSTTRPSSPFPQQIIYETNTLGLAVYDDTISDWVYLAGGPFPWMRLIKETAATVGAQTDIGWDGHQFFRGFTHDTTPGPPSVEVTVQKAGLYDVLIQVAEASPGDLPITARLHRNGAQLSRFTNDALGATNAFAKAKVQGTLDLQAGDKLKVSAQIFGNTSRNLEIAQCFWEMKWVGPVFS